MGHSQKTKKPELENCWECMVPHSLSSSFNEFPMDTRLNFETGERRRRI